MTERLCKKCGCGLTADEIALSMKLQGKQAKSYFCLDCQAQYSNTTRQRLEELLEHYHNTGICSLFPKR